MRIDESMDTGPILMQKKLFIQPDDTYPIVEEKLALLGTAAIQEVIGPYVAGSITPRAQDETQATLCKKISREDGHINWQNSATDIYNRFRAFTPWPGVWTTWQGKRLKLLSVRPASESLAPGRITARHDTLYIGCTNGSLAVTLLQLEGGKAMTAADFIRGHLDVDRTAVT